MLHQRNLNRILTFLIIALWALRVYTLGPENAREGFSPLAVVGNHFFPENFVQDYPNGVTNLTYSGFMYIYIWAYEWLKISPEILQWFVLLAEYFCTAWIAIYLYRSVVESSNWGVYLFAIWMVASGARDMDLARYHQPFFLGQYYAAADFFRFAAIALALQSRWLVAGTCAGLTFICHPMMGLSASAFIGAMAIPHLKNRNVWIGAALSAVISGGWYFFKLRHAGIAVNSIPDTTWYMMLEGRHSHWFPFVYGVFTRAHWEMFLPFLAFSSLVIALWLDRGLKSKDRQLIYGVVISMILVGIGLWASVSRVSVELVKLCLHRLNDVVIVIGLIYLAEAIAQSFSSEKKWAQKLMRNFMLVSPFVSPPGFSLLSLAAGHVLIQRENAKRWLWVSSAGIGALFIFYLASGYVTDWTRASYFAPIAVALSFCLLPLRDPKLLLPILAIVFQFTHYKILSGDPIGNAMKEAQIWASERTDKESLFLVDPTFWYGWRDYSMRSSFGSLQEWLYISWAYNFNQNLFNEGIRRAAEFGVDPQVDRDALLSRQKVRDFLYSRDRKWYSYMADKYKIDYIVLFKTRIKHPIDLPLVYQNKKIAIYRSTWLY